MPVFGFLEVNFFTFSWLKMKNFYVFRKHRLKKVPYHSSVSSATEKKTNLFLISPSLEVKEE